MDWRFSSDGVIVLIEDVLIYFFEYYAIVNKELSNLHKIEIIEIHVDISTTFW